MWRECMDKPLDGCTSNCRNQSDDDGLVSNKNTSESVTIDEKRDMENAREIDQTRERKWVSVTAHQPIDTITRTVEVPVIKTVETYKPKLVIEEKIIEVPKYETDTVEKIIEVPEVKVVDKIVEFPQVQYHYKYVPKIENKENIIERPTVEVKYIEKIVEKPTIKELIRYENVDQVEQLIRYIPEGQEIPESWRVQDETSLNGEQTNEMQHDTQLDRPIRQEFMNTESYAPHAMEPPMEDSRLEQIYKPKVVKTVEIEKKVPVAVDVPVPYMVPKPVVIPVQVPVLKFRDHFVPVPVRRRLIPRIRWTNEVYEVECIKEKPFLQVQDVIKPVPCDVEIRVHEFVDKAAPINPSELSQADVHAMWMRVNADLVEKRKEELGSNFPNVDYNMENKQFGEPGCQQPSDLQNEGDANDENMLKGLHPGHPLAMTYLQNRWIKQDTTTTHQMYTPEWFQAHHDALHNLTLQNPTQAQPSNETQE